MDTNRPALFVRKARGMGRGVFAGRAFKKGEVIEVCPVIRLPAVPEGALGVLDHYVFKWGPGGGELAVALGYGSLYNHSDRPNARFTPRTASDEIVFRARREIAAGEQILIDYEWDEEEYAAFHGPPGDRPGRGNSPPSNASGA